MIADSFGHILVILVILVTHMDSYGISDREKQILGQAKDLPSGNCPEVMTG